MKHLLKHILLLLTILVIAGIAGYVLQQQSGYLLLGYQNWTLQLPLWLTAMGLVLTIVVMYYVLRLFSFLFGITGNWRRWQTQRRMNRSHAHTLAGYVALLQADWSKVEKRFVAAAVDHPQLKFVHYLGAAVASHLGKSNHFQEYLELAHREGAAEGFIADLAHAYLLMRDQSYEKSLAILRHLQEQSPRNPLVLYLLENVLMSVQDWRSALNVLELLKKYRAITTAEYVNRAALLYIKLFDQLNKQDAESLRSFWNQIPKQVRNNHNLLAKYAELLQGKGHDDEIIKLIQNQLSYEWSDDLVVWYGKIHSSALKKQYDVAESWLKRHGNDAELLLVLGRLAKANQWWGKARSYLSTSLQLKPQPVTYVELADIAQSMNEPEQAQRYYREGLILAAKNS